jgi:hypothetical protein
VRDDQVRRYARHILLPDVGGLGQTAILVAVATLDARSGDPAATIAAGYLVAGGLGTLVLCGGADRQLAELATLGPDTRVIHDEPGREPLAHSRAVTIPGRPAWWPGAAGDDEALAFWRGGIAATTWLADAANG